VIHRYRSDGTRKARNARETFDAPNFDLSDGRCGKSEEPCTAGRGEKKIDCKVKKRESRRSSEACSPIPALAQESSERARRRSIARPPLAFRPASALTHWSLQEQTKTSKNKPGYARYATNSNRAGTEGIAGTATSRRWLLGNTLQPAAAKAKSMSLF